MFPKTYIGHYRIRNEGDLRTEAMSVTHALAVRLSRSITTIVNTSEDYLAVLEDPGSGRPIIVAWDWTENAYRVTVRKSEPGEDEAIRSLRKQIEEVLHSRGARWTFTVQDVTFGD
jgi:hypothetical protein